MFVEDSEIYNYSFVVCQGFKTPNFIQTQYFLSIDACKMPELEKVSVCIQSASLTLKSCFGSCRMWQ